MCSVVVGPKTILSLNQKVLLASDKYLRWIQKKSPLRNCAIRRVTLIIRFATLFDLANIGAHVVDGTGPNVSQSNTISLLRDAANPRTHKSEFDGEGTCSCAETDRVNGCCHDRKPNPSRDAARWTMATSASNEVDIRK